MMSSKVATILSSNKIFTSSLVFWLGDMNYRIDQDITTVKENVANGMLQKLIPHDQVRPSASFRLRHFPLDRNAKDSNPTVYLFSDLFVNNFL